MNKEIEELRDDHLRIGLLALKRLFEANKGKISKDEIMAFDFTFMYITKALQRLESIDNANPSEVLECSLKLYKMVESAGNGNGFSLNEAWKYHNTIQQALLKVQEPKQYLKWEDLEFSYGTKTQNVRMGDTIYKIEYVYYDNVKEVKLLSEDEKWFYLSFTGNYEDNVQLFNDLHLERVKE